VRIFPRPASSAERPSLQGFRRAGGVTVVVAMAAASVVSLSTAATSAGGAQAAARTDKTSKVEAKRVDRVPTPKLGWYNCDVAMQCATVKLPLDYDKPKGAKVELALLRVRAANPKKRIGSLFVNPGGPGGSGVSMAADASLFLTDSVLDRFDIVGLDPRGIGYSDNVKCFRDTKAQASALKGLDTPFPYTKAQEKAAVKSASAQAKACSTMGKPLSAAASTANVARDLDVLRRAVGDKKLTFLGFSYGTFLGGAYANMFPDRVRAVAIDGVLNPVSWTGTTKTGKLNQDSRLHSAEGASKALNEMLKRCGTAGPTKCAFAAKGNPVANFDTIATRLKRKPITIEDIGTYTYPAFVADALSALYAADGDMDIDGMATGLWELTSTGSSAAAVGTNHTPTAKRFARTVKAVRQNINGPKPTKGSFQAQAFPYDNSLDAFSAVICTDGRHPADANLWARDAAARDRKAKYFGRIWAWSTAQCAGKTWKAHDEDVYRGPFTRKTANPVLVVGNYWDPATNYTEAVSTAKLFPNSRLIKSNSWGHTAYRSSDCVSNAVDRYLLTTKVPAKNITCVGDRQPYTDVLPPDEEEEELRARTVRNSTPRPPVAPPPFLANR
jgi:pimeloyl-ACP methyl ester carboxylesterase